MRVGFLSKFWHENHSHGELLAAVLRAVAQDRGRFERPLLLAIPSFWLGTLVMVFPSIWWGWAPELRYVPFTQDPVTNLKMLLLPAVILGTGLSAPINGGNGVSNAAMVLIGLHVLAALKHQFIDKDGIFGRMLPW